MKEKTFEELIEGEFNIKLMDESDWNNIQFSALDMREFGKQVREATIKECQQKVTYRIGGYLGADKLLDDLPTDRILTP